MASGPSCKGGTAMKRFIVAFSLAVAALLLGSVGPTSATDYSVSVSCSDATVFTATLDPAKTAQLAEAVTAINTNPAGLPPLTCALSQTPLTGGGAQAADPPNDLFAAGGGKWTPQLCGSLANFSLNAHTDKNGP